MQFLKKLRQYIPGFRQLSPRSMAIALTYYAVAVAALFSSWHWGLILLALPFLLFNVIDLNRGRGRLVPLLAACAAGLAVLCGTAGVLSAGGLPGAEPVTARTSAARIASAKPLAVPSASAESAPAAPTVAAAPSIAPVFSASGTPAPAGSGPAALAATASPEAAPTEQAQYAYVASKNSKSFHRPDCASAKRIKPENLIGFHSREEAVKAGLQPCKRCKP